MFAISILTIDKPTATPGEPRFRPFTLPDREVLKLPLSNSGISGAHARLRSWLGKGWSGFTFEMSTEPGPGEVLVSTHDWKKLMILGFPEDTNAPFERFSISGSVITVARFESPIVEYLEQNHYVPTDGVATIKQAVRWQRRGLLESRPRRSLLDKRLKRMQSRLN